MEKFMKEALRQAKKAAERGEVPVGAVAVLKGKIIARAYNKTITLNDPTAHAEILLLKKAARKVGNYRLNDVEIYVTKEPCPMCAGAMIHARIKSLIYGTPDEKGGAFSRFGLDLRLANHRFEVHSGILAEESAKILKEFFKARRGTEVAITGSARNRLSR